MRSLVAVVALVVGVTACSGDDSPAVALDGDVAPLVPAPAPPVVDGVVTSPDGNRYRPGSFVLADAEHLVVDLPSPAAWVVAIPGADSWAVVSEDGAVREVDSAGTVIRTLEGARRHEPTIPPTVVRRDGHVVVETALDRGGIGVWDEGAFRVEVRVDGQASLLRTDLAEGFLVEDVLPDTRPVRVDQNRVALLTHPTDDYAHGILGDDLEATAVSVWDFTGVGRRIDPVAVHRVGKDEVIEDLAPIVADVDLDGTPEFVVTVSDPTEGGRVVALGELGRRDGPTVGRPGRWIHVIGVAPTGADGVTEIVAVQTPHVGGRLQFLRPTGAGDLRVVAETSEYRSHRIGSRNLSMAVLVDASGDGRPDVVLPDQASDALVVVGRTIDAAEPSAPADEDGGTIVHARISLDAAVSTNLVTMVRGDVVSLAVGTEDGRLHLFR